MANKYKEVHRDILEAVKSVEDTGDDKLFRLISSKHLRGNGWGMAWQRLIREKHLVTYVYKDGTYLSETGRQLLNQLTAQ